MPRKPARPSPRRSRAATEQLILEAFERVLLREGVHGVGVNGVALEAGVSKVLIYRYYGDLEGLARQWASTGDIWPSELELIGHDPEGFESLSLHERVKAVLLNYIDAIGSREQTVQAMIAELLSPNDISRAIEVAAAKHGNGVGTYIKPDRTDRVMMDRIWRLIVLVRSVTFYWCIRRNGNPDYMGMDLKQPEAWTFLKETIADIADTYLPDGEASARSQRRNVRRKTAL